ncbi:MAG: hypothetical protein R6V04_14585, partial [bacterium]
MISAVALVSSGLDSILAAKIVSDQSVRIRGVLFYFIFDNLYYKIKNEEIDRILHSLNIPIDYIDITESMVQLLQSEPEHGFGKGINPCIDCHIIMLKNAYKIMKKTGADFLITGEVAGQRPMSQKETVLRHIDKSTDLKGLILRPLSAKLLEETIPEKNGWVDREKLYDIAGRSRKRQIKLAEKLGIKKYGTPAGGCILTDPEFSKRVKLFREKRGKENISKEELILMRLGRYFWLKDNLQVVVGRNEKENELLESFSRGRWVFRTVTEPGPLVLALGIEEKEDIRLTGSLVSRYCTKKQSETVKVKYENKDEGVSGFLDAVPVSEEKLEEWRLLMFVRKKSRTTMAKIPPYSAADETFLIAFLMYCELS